MFARDFFACSALVVLLLASATAFSADPAPPAQPVPDFAAELPRFAPVEPKDALATMRVQPGFRMELVASEPLIGSPVAICWDERGRMHVVEMRGYSEHRDEKLSRIKLLTDTNNDGVYDEAKVFADGLLWPTAIICWEGGVFVGDAPDILYLKDTDGDGKADVRRRVYTGFGTQNVQGLLNTFLWGLDCRIHGATSSNGGEIRLAMEDDEKRVMKPLSLRGRDFSFDPRNPADLRAESGGGQHGMTFDDWGHKFVCSNSDHVQQIMYEDRYLARNPSLAAPSPRVSIAADGPQAPVFRASPIEPWRVLRTRLRVEGKVPGPIEGGGKPAGYFTGATGLTMIRGDAFEETVRGTLVVGDVGSNLIHRKRLKLGSANSALEYVAERIDPEGELVASTDSWFRPAQFANGPDGALYVIDVYREVIEHPASLPPAIKKHLDLNSGRDRGRIWRLSSSAANSARAKGRPLPALDQANTAELVRMLEHANVWTREAAARVLYERRDPATLPELRRLIEANRSPLAQVTALGLVQALEEPDGVPEEKTLLALLESNHPCVRARALRWAEHAKISETPEFRGDLFEGAIVRRLSAMTADGDAQVRFQLALTLGGLPRVPIANALLAELLRRDGGDSWMRFACLSSLKPPYGASLAELLRHERVRRDPNQRAALVALSSRIAESPITGKAPDWNEVEAYPSGGCLEELERWPPEDSLLALSIASPLAAYIRRWKLVTGGKSEPFVTNANPADVAERVMPVLARQALARLKTVVPDRNASVRERIDAVRTMKSLPFADVSSPLADLLNPQEPAELQTAALAALADFKEMEAVETILRGWPIFSPAVRRVAAELLVSRPERCLRLLDAIEMGKVPAAEIERGQVDLLEKHAQATIRDRARKVFANVSLAKRQEVVDAYRGVLDRKGDAGRGKAIFAKNCSACHRLEEVGSETGPNLAAMKARGMEAILLNVLDPNREVNPQYLTYVVSTKQGRTFSGMISAETATSLTLRQADGRSETILRADIDELRGTGLSLMPEGMEKQIDQAAMADLLAYLMVVK